MTRKQAIDFLTKKPYKFGHLIGFIKLKPINNKWMVKMIKGKGDATLKASRGTYKTTCVSIALAVIIVLLPNKRTLFMRKTDTDVKEVIKQVQKILLTPQMQIFVRIIYGVTLILTVQSATEVSTNLTTDIKGTSQLVGIGTGSSLTGKHFDYIFTDDIVNINDRISRAERERTKIVYQELLNLKNRDGRIFNTGTTWHSEDAFSIMPKAEEYNCYHEELSEIISKEEIEELKSKMLPSLFSANYELRFVASEDVIFSNEKRGGNPQLLEQAKYTHIDASYGGGDYTAFTVGKRVDNKLYVFGKLWNKHVDECLDEIIKYKQGFMAYKIWCEDNGDKGYLGKEIRRKNERTVTYHEHMNKFLKITTYLKQSWDDIVFVDGTDEEYIQQILDFNENAEHDDAPDSLACICRLMYNKGNDTERPISELMR